MVAAALASADETGGRHAAASSPHPLATALLDPTIDAGGANAAIELGRAHAAGATFIRIDLFWSSVAVRKGGDPSDPANPAYAWGAYDQTLRTAVADGLTPIVTIVLAPVWARSDPQSLRPDPGALAAFATAAARRYSGSFRGLPRVRYWMIWNEPDLEAFLSPQTENGELTAATWYRRMVNASYEAIHAVRRDDFVIAGGLAPYVGGGTPPLDFMRAALCVEPKCSDTIRFDAWSVHPYTYGGPTHPPATPNGVALGNLSQVRALLVQQQRAGIIVAPRPVQFFVTEFGYDSDPPDPAALPFSLQTRWVSQALYEMWRNRVSVVTWFLLRDLPRDKAPFQSGLYFTGSTVAADRPKPTLRAFRFPFIALVDGHGTTLWGRTPWGKPGTVLVQKRTRGSWKKVMELRTDRFGIFQKHLRSRSTAGSMRAMLADRSDFSLPFGLKPVPDRHVNPFGS